MELTHVRADQPTHSTAVRLHQDWARALLDRDADWLDRHLDAGLVYVAFDGELKSKAGMIAQVRKSAVTEATTIVESVREYGGLVIVSGVNSLRTSSVADASTMSEAMRTATDAGVRVRYTSVWSFDGADYRLLHHHTTRMASSVDGRQ